MKAGLLVFVVLSVASAAPTEDDSDIRIIGGTPVSPGELPFVVSIQIKGSEERPNEHICGGTLVSMSRVITAASCLLPAIPSTYLVAAGATVMRDVLLGHMQVRRLRRITLHPNFTPSNVHNDIAILDLDSPFSESTGVEPIPAASRTTQTYPASCLIAGWGQAGSVGEKSDNLRKASIRVFSRDECKTAHGDNYNPTRELCGNGIDELGNIIEACDGDKGGPLVCEDNEGKWYAAGVAAWRPLQCEDSKTPGVYMEISKYRDWLDTILPGGNHDQNSTTAAPTTGNPTTTKPGTVNDELKESPAFENVC